MMKTQGFCHTTLKNGWLTIRSDPEYILNVQWQRSLQAGGGGTAPVSQIAYNRLDLKIYGLRNPPEIEKKIFSKNLPKI